MRTGFDRTVVEVMGKHVQITLKVLLVLQLRSQREELKPTMQQRKRTMRMTLSLQLRSTTTRRSLRCLQDLGQSIAEYPGLGPGPKPTYPRVKGGVGTIPHKIQQVTFPGI